MWKGALSTLQAALVAGPIRIHDIQAAAHRSPLVDRDVTGVEGVVTQLGAGAFYLQDPLPDGDDATSEGIRVSSGAPVAVGDWVAVDGTVREVRPGCASCVASSEAFSNLSTTEIAASSVVVMGHGVALPAPVRVGGAAGARRPPSEIIEDDARGDVELAVGIFDPEHDGLDFYESLEGMRVEVGQPRATGPTIRPPGRSAEVAVVANEGEGFGPFTSRGGLRRLEQDDNPERMIVSGGPGAALPILDVGDAFTAPLVGVIDYSFGSFKLVAAASPVGFRLAPPRASFVPAPTDELSVVTFNVQNLGPASPSAKLDGIADLLVGELGAPDLVVLQEMQDDSGPLDDGTTDGTETYVALVEAIVAHAGPRYDFRDVAPGDAEDGGQPGANIRVGFLIRPDRGLAVIDRPGPRLVNANLLRSEGGRPYLARSPGRVDPENPAFFESRKPVALELRFRDEAIFVVGVHFNSQLGDAPLFGRFQPPGRPSRVQRTAQARVVADFVRQLLAIDPGANVLVAGDMNDVEGSPPLVALEQAGLASATERVPEGERYSYVFQGNAELIDHVLLSRSLRERMVDVRIAHANADYARAPSDHDPVAVRMNVRPDVDALPRGCHCASSKAHPSWGAAVSWVVLAGWLARRGRKLPRRAEGAWRET